MGFFSKKTCTVCGGKIKKDFKELSDGLLCKKCLKSVSPWFPFEPETTVEQVKNHMALKSQKESEQERFSRDCQYGEGLQKLYIDKAQRKFMITDKLGHNPEVYSLDAIQSCRLNKREGLMNSERELKTSLRRDYMYSFGVAMTMDDPFVKEILFEYRAKPVMTGTTRLTDESFEDALSKSDSTMGRINNFLGGLSQKVIDTIESNIAEGNAIIADLTES